MVIAQHGLGDRMPRHGPVPLTSRGSLVADAEECISCLVLRDFRLRFVRVCVGPRWNARSAR